MIFNVDGICNHRHYGFVKTGQLLYNIVTQISQKKKFIARRFITYLKVEHLALTYKMADQFDVEQSKEKRGKYNKRQKFFLALTLVEKSTFMTEFDFSELMAFIHSK